MDNTGNPNRFDCSLIVRVLTYQGNWRWAPDDLQPHLSEISNRYLELKRTNDFQTANLIANTEWVERQLNTDLGD
jgi:hypothetical protein